MTLNLSCQSCFFDESCQSCWSYTNKRTSHSCPITPETGYLFYQTCLSSKVIDPIRLIYKIMQEKTRNFLVFFFFFDCQLVVICLILFLLFVASEILWLYFSEREKKKEKRKKRRHVMFNYFLSNHAVNSHHINDLA